MQRLRLIALTSTSLALIVFVAPQAFAQSSGQPDELQAIYACKSIADSQERLSCYDKSVGRFQAAEKSGEVVTVSKTAIEKVERDAFGFNIPSLPSLNRLFGSKGKSPKPKSAKKQNDLTAPLKQAETMPAIDSTTPPINKPVQPQPSDINAVTLEIRKTAEFGYKRTRFFMDNGQVWEQVDDKKVRVPKVRNDKANTAAISKAALGSYLLRVNGKGTAIRVRRVR